MSEYSGNGAKRWLWYLPVIGVLVLIATTSGHALAAWGVLGVFLASIVLGRVVARRQEALFRDTFRPVTARDPAGRAWSIRPVAARYASRLPGQGDTALAVYALDGPTRGRPVYNERSSHDLSKRAHELAETIVRGGWSPTG